MKKRKDTVPKEDEDDEIEAVDHAAAVNTSQWEDAFIHNFIPILAGENLKKTGKSLTNYNYYKIPVNCFHIYIILHFFFSFLRNNLDYYYSADRMETYYRFNA